MLPSAVIAAVLLLSVALQPCAGLPNGDLDSGSGTTTPQSSPDMSTDTPTTLNTLTTIAGLSTETTPSELATVKTTIPYTYMTVPPATADDPWRTAASFDEVGKKLHATSLGPVTEHTVNALLAAYERLVDLSVGQTPDDATALQISQDTASILSRLANEPFPTQARSARFVVQVVRHASLAVDRAPLNSFHGESVFRSDSLQVSVLCIVSSLQHAGFVVHPADASVLRAPPTHARGRVVAFRVVDLVLMPQGGLGGRRAATCPASVYLDMLLLKWTAPNVGPNVRYACAAWTGARWSTDDCLASRDPVRTRRVTCFCDAKGDGASTAYVVYAYLEDVAHGLLYAPSNATVRDPRDAAELHACVEDAVRLAEDPTAPASFDALVAGPLTRLALFDADLWPNATDVTRMSDAIGAVLLRVAPRVGDDVIGRGSGVVTGVAFRMETYRHDPVTAFSFYKEAASWMEYARSHDVIDWDVLFHEHNAFVMMLSATTAQQNLRYGFVLFPVDRYLTPIPAIDGHPVVASRVFDLVLDKQHDLNDRRDQFVHLLFNPATAGRAPLRHGCAYWSHRNATWSTRDCRADPAVYRHVCTCNLTASFNESRARGQYAAFVYEEAVDAVDAEVEGQAGIEFVAVSLFALQKLRKYGDGDRTVVKEVELLSRVFVAPNGSLKMNQEVKVRAIAEARALLAANECKPHKMDAIAESFGVLCFDSTHADADDPVVSLAFARGISDSVVTQRASTFAVDEMVNDKMVFAVSVSDSVTRHNARYAILVYPTDICLRTPPTMDQQVLSLRVIDFVLVADPLPKDDADQTFLMYLDQSSFNATQSCAYWSDDWQQWTEIGCFGVTLGARTVCNCSLSMHFAEHRDGGQFVAFTYSDFYFNETAFAALTTPEAAVDADATLAVASTLVRNASMLPAHDELVFKTLQVTMRVFSLDVDFLSTRGPGVKSLLADQSTLLARYRTDPRRSVLRSFGIGADAATDLTANAVDDPSHVERLGASAVLLAAVGYYKGDAGRRPAGLYFLRGDEEQVFFAYGDPGATFSQPNLTRMSFACLLPSAATARYYRLILVIYPLNTSPFPSTMTPFPVFNARQLDVHVDVANPYSSTLGLPRPDGAPLDVHFQPDASPASFVRVGCSTWNDAADAWTDALCTLNASDAANVFCRCDVGRQSVTRVVVFEYTDAARFPSKDRLEASNIVFLVFASASLFGLLGIVVTAAGHREWRAQPGHAALTQAAVACFAHLVLASIRETHPIVAARNLPNASLVAFAAFLHYARLAHYACALTASALLARVMPDWLGSRRLLAKMALPSWGVPLVLVVAMLVWDAEEHFCTPTSVAHYVLFVVPGVVFVGVSAVIVVAAWRREGDEGTPPRASVLIGVVFGVPALVETFNGVWVHDEALEVAYKLMDAGQGLGLFLFFVAFDNEVRDWWAKRVLSKDREALEGQDTQIEMTCLSGKIEQ